VRAYTARALRKVALVLVDQRGDAADACPESDSDAVAIGVADLKAGVGQCLFRRDLGKLREAVGASGKPAPQRRFAVEALHLGGEVRFEGGGIELRDRPGAGPAGQRPLPTADNVVSQRAEAAHACDHDTSAFHRVPLSPAVEPGEYNTRKHARRRWAVC
jgi:hypothetical protein